MSSSLSTYRNKLDTLKARLSNAHKRAREESEEITETVVEVVAGAGYGAAEARWGTDAIMGASIPLVVGVAATGAALMGYGGGMAGVIAAVGRAGLTVEAYRRGADLYREWDTREGA